MFHTCKPLNLYSELRRINTIRHLLSVDSTKARVSTFVLSRLNCCNSLLSGCPKHLEKLQKVQNSAARLVLKAHKRDHVSPLLRTLHWLPFQASIEFNLSTLCHSFFSDTVPAYLSDFIHVYSPSGQLRSSSDSGLIFMSRSFCLGVLPRGVGDIQSTTAFWAALKIQLFKSYLC